MKFSIIIPVYKYSSYLDSALISCFNQTYDNFDIYLVDDGSPESFNEKIETLKGENNYNRDFYFYSIENIGAAGARNFAAKMSNSDYLVFLDADDILDENALSFYRKALENRSKNCVLASKRFEFFQFEKELADLKSDKYEDLEIIKFKNYFSNKINFRFGASNIILPREKFIEVGGFKHRNDKTSHFEDHDVLLKLGNLEEFLFIQSPKVVYYRIHEDNSIHDIKKIGYGVLEIIETNEKEGYPGRDKYRIQRYEIIGASVFHTVLRLIKTFKFLLASIVIIKGFKYICYYIKSKIRKNGRRKSV